MLCIFFIRKVIQEANIWKSSRTEVYCEIVCHTFAALFIVRLCVTLLLSFFTRTLLSYIHIRCSLSYLFSLRSRLKRSSAHLLFLSFFSFLTLFLPIEFIPLDSIPVVFVRLPSCSAPSVASPPLLSWLASIASEAGFLPETSRSARTYIVRAWSTAKEAVSPNNHIPLSNRCAEREIIGVQGEKYNP